MSGRITAGLLLLLIIGATATTLGQAGPGEHYRRADSLYIAGQYHQAAREFASAAETAPSSERFRYLFLSAKAYYRADEFNDARRRFEDCLDEGPPDYVAAASHFYLGNIDFETADFRSAADHFARAVNLDLSPARRDVYLRSLSPLLTRDLNIEQAEQVFRSINNRKARQGAFCHLAEAYYDAGLCEELLDQADYHLSLNEPSPCADRVAKLQQHCFMIQQNQVRIGILAPQTGPLAAYGSSIVEGATLALEEYGAPDSPTLEVDTRDTEGTPLGAARAVVDMAATPLSAVVGPLTSQEAPAVIARTCTEDVPVISPTASTAGLTDIADNFVQLTPSPAAMIRKLSRFAVGDLMLDSVALIYPDDPDGRQAATIFIETAERSGTDVFYVRSFLPTAADYREILLDLKRLLLPDEFDPEIFIDDMGDTLETESAPVHVKAICIPASVSQLELIIPQVNFYKIDTDFLGGEDWGADRIVGMSELQTRTVYFVDDNYRALSGRDYTYFYRAYERRFTKAPDEIAARSYDAARMITAAISQVGPDPGQILEFLRQSSFVGINGEIELNDRIENESVHVYKISGGEVERVK
jgi:ABC-type branched-subunit amino acid transport system substrate-binding protein